MRPSAYLSTAHEDDWNEVLPWTVRVTVLETTEPRPLVEKWIFSRIMEAHAGAITLVGRLTVMLRAGGRVGKRQRGFVRVGARVPACSPAEPATNRAGGAMIWGAGRRGGGGAAHRNATVRVSGSNAASDTE